MSNDLRAKYEEQLAAEETGASLIHILVKNRDLDAVKSHLISGSNSVEITNDAGHTPLMFSVMLNCRDIMRFLLKYKQNVNTRDMKGFTALMYAANVKDNNHEFICPLVVAGADMNLVFPKEGYEWMNWKAIDLAFFKLHTENVKTLTELGSEVIGDSCMIASYREGKTSISSLSILYNESYCLYGMSVNLYVPKNLEKYRANIPLFL